MTGPPPMLSADRRALLRKLSGAVGPAADRITVVPRDRGLPFTSAQHRLWFIDRLAPGSARYHVASGLWLHGPLDVGRLRGALTAVVRRHEVLRTVFGEDARGELVARATPGTGVSMPVLAAGGVDDALRRAERFVREPMDLAAGPLIRTVLFRLGPDHHLLAVVVHHIVVDGWSYDVLVADLVTAYRAGAGALDPLPIQFADFAAWQRDLLAGGPGERQLRHWLDRLAGASAPDLPTDRARPARPTHDGASETVEIPAETASALAGCARRHRATPFMAVLAATAAAFARWSRQTDFVLGCPAAARQRAEVAPLVGLFVNTLALRLDMSGNPTFGTLLDRVRDVVLAGQANADVSFADVVSGLRLDHGDRGGSPLIRHWVQYDELPPATARVGELELRRQFLDTGTAKFDLMLYFSPTAGGGLTCRVEYSTELYDGATVARIATAIRLICAAAGKDLPLSRLPLMTGADRARLINGFADGDASR